MKTNREPDFVVLDVDTRNFSFRGVGRTEAEARAALRAALAKHAREYRVERPVAWVMETLADASVSPVHLGAGYRDGFRIA